MPGPVPGVPGDGEAKLPLDGTIDEPTFARRAAEYESRWYFVTKCKSKNIWTNVLSSAISLFVGTVVTLINYICTLIRTGNRPGHFETSITSSSQTLQWIP